jgi:signal transduction histidine kinase
MDMEGSPARSGLRRGIRGWTANPRIADVIPVLLIAVLALTEPSLGYGWLDSPAEIALEVVALGALLVRRAAPFTIVVLIGSIIFALNAFFHGDPSSTDLALMVGVYAVASHRGSVWAVAAIGVQIVAYLPLLNVAGTCDASCQVAWTAVFVFAAIAGVAVHEGRRLNERLAEQAEILRQTRQERARSAILEERSRVARDLHDVVGHSVTGMVVQAGAARALAETDAARSSEALAAVELIGAEALRELAGLVGSLGADLQEVPDGSPSPPGPEHHSIASLVDHAVGTGLRVGLVIEGSSVQIDPGREISVYRIVQEALTNVRKHAPSARVEVHVSYLPVEVVVEVTDSGSPDPGPQRVVPGAGQGLVGIGERAALFGGHAEAGPTTSGGFRVHAQLPLEEAPA